ncbi:MAG: TolC family outer membrane protein [Pseudomonadota bacterium]|jgi:outer membrane protein
MKLKTLTLLLAALASAPALSADLLDAYHAAQGQDPTFAAARATHQAGQEKLAQGRSLLLPSVNLSANTTYNDNLVHYQNPGFLRSGVARYNTHGYGASLVQPLFRQQNWIAYSQSDLQVALADAQFHAAEQDLILRVSQAYFDVLLAQDNVQLAAAQKTAISEQLEQAKRNFEVGTATITDTHEAQARYDLVVAQEIAAQSNLEIRKRALQQLTGKPAEDLRPLAAELDLSPLQPEQIDKWDDEAQQHNPQVEAAKIGAELADKEVSKAAGGHLPTVDLVANYNKNYATGGTFGPNDNRMTSVGVVLNMPLFQGGLTQSKWREADANREKARQDLEFARRSVSVQTRQAYLGVANGAAQVRALQQALKSSESLLDASKTGQEVGVRTNLDVLNAQQQLFSTRRDLLQAEYNYLMNRLRLKAAAGTLNETDLSNVNKSVQ